MAERFEGQQAPILLTSVFVIAVCGILYELLISSISTYLLGSSILHFSVTIGLFLSAMGVGSFLSRYVTHGLYRVFINVEIILGILGGASALILYLSFSVTEYYYLVVFLQIVLLGSLIGLEIPVVTRLLKEHDTFKDTIAKVLGFDYLGSLFASVLFPLILLPYLGLVRTSFVIGLINLSIALFNTWVFREKLKNSVIQFGVIGFSSVLLIGGFFYSFQISSFLEQLIYADQIIYTGQSKYQRIVVTKQGKNTRLYLNGNLQFSTIDKYRYHEPLIHLPASLTSRLDRVLVLGGGDGLALPELLKYKEIQHIDLVDLDEEVTNLAQRNPIFKSLNGDALAHPAVHVHNRDAFKFVEEADTPYNLIIIDLPDPHDAILGKLYSAEFYRMANRLLTADGALITQATSPFFATKAYWCIAETMEQVFPYVVPVNAYVPAFGPWGFVVGVKAPQAEGLGKAIPQEKIHAAYAQHFEKHPEILKSLRHLKPEVLPKHLVFEADYRLPEDDSVRANRLDDLILVHYYENSWNKWE